MRAKSSPDISRNDTHRFHPLSGNARLIHRVFVVLIFGLVPIILLRDWIVWLVLFIVSISVADITIFRLRCESRPGK